jgi:hypothetical protein
VPYVTPFSFWKTDVLTAPQMPTFIVFKDGAKAGDLVGANPQGLHVCPPIV